MELEELYEAIDKQRQRLISLLGEKNPMDPIRLSDVCMKLATLNGMLGDYLPGLKTRQLETERAIYEASKALKVSDTAATAAARLTSHKEREEYARADIKHTDIWKLISMAQSHIKALTEERKSS